MSAAMHQPSSQPAKRLVASHRRFAAARCRCARIALALLIGACSGGEPAGRQDQRSAALMCAPGTARPCPCAGTNMSMGTQSCDATGRSYSACIGCPALSARPLPPTAGGATPSIAGAGGGAAPTTDAGAAGNDAAAQSDGSNPTLDQGGAVPGTSCGVGLPALCAPGREKCCVRSLAADTCIAADAACDCELDGCTVMEAYCDGPEDCAAGEVCCGTLASDSSGYESFACATQCQSTGNQRAACHVDESECPSSYICANSQLLTNVQVCIDPASIEQ
jgi:hypothetical protein